MITEYIRYRIEGARADTFVADYARAAKSLDASPYCIGYDLTRCVKTPEHFILRILWTSADDHPAKFRASADFGPFLDAIRPYIGDIAEMEHYDATGVSSATGLS